MSRQSLHEKDFTVAEALKKANYSTALIGKWGLGEVGQEGHPLRQGFDYLYGYLNQVHAHNYPNSSGEISTSKSCEMKFSLLERKDTAVSLAEPPPSGSITPMTSLPRKPSLGSARTRARPSSLPPPHHPPCQQRGQSDVRGRRRGSGIRNLRGDGLAQAGQRPSGHDHTHGQGRRSHSRPPEKTQDR